MIRQAESLGCACNEFAAQMVADHPTGYGISSLPLPGIWASLPALNYALDVLTPEVLC